MRHGSTLLPSTIILGVGLMINVEAVPDAQPPAPDRSYARLCWSKSPDEWQEDGEWRECPPLLYHPNQLRKSN
jgi:hypothetical protein